MVKVTVYYCTFFDRDTGEIVRPRRPGTLAAIAHTCLTSATPLLSLNGFFCLSFVGFFTLMKTAKDVEESALDDQGLYPRRACRTSEVEGRSLWGVTTGVSSHRREP